MIYLLDANVLIDANRDYYPIERVPEFWEWLIFVGNGRHVKIPPEVYEEISASTSDLEVWIEDDKVTSGAEFRRAVDSALQPDARSGVPAGKRRIAG